MIKIRFTRKKWLLITAVSLFIVTILGYTGYSMYSWQGYEKNYTTAQRQTKSDLDEVLALPMASLKEREQKLTKLQKVAIGLKKKQSTTCQPNAAVQWQTFFDSIQDQRSRCQSITDKNSNVLTALDVISTYLENERTFATELNTVASQPSVSDESNWADTADAWHQLAISSAAAGSDKVFESTKQVTITAIAGIDSSWQELLSAHGTKDKPRFVTAQANLVAAYDGLSAITDENNKQLTLLDQKLTAVYKTAF